ncbi:DUF2950 domain-containing protein [Geomonas sp.]|uniref:DUF2950 domain-containing protein n=1 Tax=Geomonas sp. TaxID=2651584 RepID=UPI002B4656DF|nr:DUF2950 domain-containing protein [Geomonas sp.]HJV35888.1 DUF2950 domain-containing protein [Geomonas sp.]
MMLNTSRRLSQILLLLSALLAVLSVVVLAPEAATKQAQRTFASPEDAAKGLIAALKNSDAGELSSIFGPGSQAVVASGDPVADQRNRERFVALYDEKNGLQDAGAGRKVLVVGPEDYPFPIPIVGTDGSWRFDLKAGREELLNRRIGRNELEAIEVLYAYVDAQRDYATEDRGGQRILQFAQKIRSTPGKKDGLYWEAREGEPESPFGPLAAKADREGYKKLKTGGTPFHGYFFRILKAQGKHAPGGAFDYVVNGKMVLGFAMVAYPAQYGSTGVMTFIVNQDGAVYQKNLGKNTSKAAQAMKLYDPDPTWKKVQAE